MTVIDLMSVVIHNNIQTLSILQPWRGELRVREHIAITLMFLVYVYPINLGKLKFLKHVCGDDGVKTLQITVN